MKRRLELMLFLWLCSVAQVFAQNSGSLPIVGVLRLDTPESVKPFQTVFRDALAALGQVDGATCASTCGRRTSRALS